MNSFADGRLVVVLFSGFSTITMVTTSESQVKPCRAMVECSWSGGGGGGGGGGDQKGEQTFSHALNQRENKAYNFSGFQDLLLACFQDLLLYGHKQVQYVNFHFSLISSYHTPTNH